MNTPNFMNTLVNWITKQFLKSRLKRIEKFVNKPLESQENVFNQLVFQAKNTQWGKNYDYKTIQNPLTFQNRVPISTYEDLFPYIKRMMQGEKNVLWSSPIPCFSKSSGTTNARSKYIPVSKESLHDCHFAAGKDMLAIYLNNFPDSQLFAGKGISIGGSHEPNPYNSETYCGDVSALIMKNLPFWVEFTRTPSIDVALMPEWESKLERIAKDTIHEDIISLQGVPTWTIFIIRKVLELTGKECILDVWQNLEVFFHGAVAFEPYQALFKEMIPSPNMRYVEVYNASEGFLAVQDQTDTNEMLLMLNHGIFYEFIPMENIHDEQPKTIGLEQVELGKNYAVIISTNGGLWRYNIGDTVRFTSLYPFRVKISGRTKHFINAFGEEVVVENAETAISKACQMTNATISNFTAAPIYIETGKRGGHEWAIEFVKKPNDIDVFVKGLDNTLREINSDYDAKRYNDIALVAPKVHVLEQGSFYRWMKKRGKLGGQNKVPRLSNSREYLDDLLEMLTYELS